MNDVSKGPDQEQPVCRFIAIFMRQRELMNRYHHIEKANGQLHTEAVPVDLDDRFGQARLKHFAWCIVEELSEAHEALVWSGYRDSRFREELIDSLHFLVELAILSNMSGDRIIQLLDTNLFLSETFEPDLLAGLFNIIDHPTVGAHPTLNQTQERIFEVITSLGWTMNCLKMKPWKQSFVATDVGKYQERLASIFGSFFRLFYTVKMDADEVYGLYCHKASVNAHRQQNNY